MTLPGAEVEGVGAAALPVPPVAVVYQSRLLPVAVSGAAVLPIHRLTGLLTVGAPGVICGRMVMVAAIAVPQTEDVPTAV